MLKEDNNQIYIKGELIGEGEHKKVYSVIGHNDKVMKTGKKVLEEAIKCQKIPDVTPIIYHIDKENNFTIVEKLDMLKAKKLFEKNIPTNRINFRSKAYVRRLLKNTTDPESIKFINDITNVVRLTKIIDIKPENFGYDKSNVLKCLDLTDW